MSSFHGIDAMFIPYKNGSVTTWLSNMIALFNAIASISTVLIQGEFWISEEFYPASMVPLFQSILKSISQGWLYTMNKYNTANYGDYVAAKRVSIRIYKSSDIATVPNIADRYPCSNNLALDRGYQPCINTSMNVIAQQSTILLPPDVLKSAHHNDPSKLSTPLVIAHTSIDKNGSGRSFILHPEYPCMEPIISSDPRCHS